MKGFGLYTMSRNPHRSVNCRHTSVNSDMLPMIRYCILPGTVQYGTVLTYSHSLLAPGHLGPKPSRPFFAAEPPRTTLEARDTSKYTKSFKNYEHFPERTHTVIRVYTCGSCNTVGKLFADCYPT